MEFQRITVSVQHDQRGVYLQGQIGCDDAGEPEFE
jgi:hypothetical protein